MEVLIDDTALSILHVPHYCEPGKMKSKVDHDEIHT